jgi:hypothetical protein
MFLGFLTTEQNELLEEAADTRVLASSMGDPASVRDLQSYAAALEGQAAALRGLPRISESNYFRMTRRAREPAPAYSWH